MIKSKQYQNLTFIVILNPPLKKVHHRIDATKDPKGEMNREHSLTLWFINWERRIRCRSHSIFTSLPKQKKGTQKSREIAATLPFRSLVKDYYSRLFYLFILIIDIPERNLKTASWCIVLKFTILIFRNARFQTRDKFYNIFSIRKYW